MTEAVAEKSGKQLYLDALSMQGGAAAPDWLRAVREAGARRFEALPFPTQKDEEWRFTDIRPILRRSFGVLAEASSPQLDDTRLESILFAREGWTELVFVDGFFARELSSIGNGQSLHVSTLAEAALGNGAIAQQYLDRLAGERGGVFSAMNSAFLRDGSLVHARRGHAGAPPVHVVYISTGQQAGNAAYPRNLVVLDETAELTLIESYVGLSDAPYFNDAVTELVLGEEAVLRRYKVLHEGAQGYHLSTTRVEQGRGSVFRSFSAFLGGRIARNDLRTRLAGEGADAALEGLYLAEGEQLIDNATGIEHADPNCTSRIRYKGVLDGASHAVFSGKIYVHRGAQKTDSNQLNSNLLLSDKAVIDTKPLLEIFADDVKCTHGATVGPPPKKQLFYFQSRGISEAKARALLTCGFAGEVVDEISVEPLRARLHEYIYNRYNPR